MTGNEWDGVERRVEPDLDISEGGRFYDILREQYFEPADIPQHVCRLVEKSEGRLVHDSYRVGHPQDPVEDCYMVFHVKAVERRGKQEPIIDDEDLIDSPCSGRSNS
jgi:hypothetical protein